MIIDIEHIGMSVRSLDAAKKTLCDVMGFPITLEKALPQLGCNVAFIKAGASVLEVVEWDDKTALQGQSAQIDHLALKVKNIEQVVSQLRDAGVQFAATELGIAERMGRRFWYIYTSPESTFGIRFQLVEEILPTT